MSGLFITFEGTDGSGKSTQIKLLEEYFNREGFSVISIRDPGGTPISEKIRNILLDKRNKGMSYMTETLLYSASRSQLVEQKIIPALKRGSVVICDRFMDSNLVYQGIARKVGVQNVETINNIAIGKIIPDITFFLSLSPKESIKRKRNKIELDRLEQEKIYFHREVYNGYIKVADKYPKRIKIINAALKVEEIHREIINEISNIFMKNGFNY